MSDRWPALMTRETAAQYCDMSPAAFDRQCPVAPVDQGWRGLRWKRSGLDAWIEGLPEKPRQRAQEGLQTVDGSALPALDKSAPTPAERKQAAIAGL